MLLQWQAKKCWNHKEVSKEINGAIFRKFHWERLRDNYFEYSDLIKTTIMISVQFIVEIINQTSLNNATFISKFNYFFVKSTRYLELISWYQIFRNTNCHEILLVLISYDGQIRFFTIWGTWLYLVRGDIQEHFYYISLLWLAAVSAYTSIYFYFSTLKQFL